MNFAQLPIAETLTAGASSCPQDNSPTSFDGARSRGTNTIARIDADGRCGIRVSPIVAADPTLELTLFSDSPGPVRAEVFLLGHDRTELTRNGKPIGRRSCAVVLNPIANAPTDAVTRRILSVCNSSHSGKGTLWIPEALRKRAHFVTVTISTVLQSSTQGNDARDNFHVTRQKCRMGLGDDPKPDYGFPLTEGESSERIEQLVGDYGLLHHEDGWEIKAVDRLIDHVRSCCDSPLVTDDLATSLEVGRIMGGIIKFAKLDDKHDPALEGLADEIAAPPGELAVVDPERLEWQREIVESLIRECTPNANAFGLVKKKLFEGKELKTLSDEFEIHYPTARVHVHRAKKYLGLL